MNALALNLFLQLSLGSLPTILVCLGACIVILSKWQRDSSWQLWALLGFGLGLVIALAFPITQAVVQSWVAQSGNITHYVWVFSALGFFWSLLRACVYILIFVAVIEGRK